jgi:pimeloyl-ACP methyl ester carboxylesterase|tara:strand:- start:742 stop:1182 length:441 start_codon:yes stop_codon:yes gene_type:complete
VFFFQLAFAEVAVSLDDFAFIHRLWEEWSPTWEFAADDIAPVIETLTADGVLASTLGYYRALFNPDFSQDRYAVDQARGGEARPIVVPSLHLHGDMDGCIGHELLAGMSDHYPAGLELKVLPNLGHFLHREDPNWVSRLIVDFISK